MIARLLLSVVGFADHVTADLPRSARGTALANGVTGVENFRDDSKLGYLEPRSGYHLSD